ncbi:MAG: MnmC family methyltransferase [Cyanobacteriota bacterium]|nr:MnmC family methyltransferase [Cyanobacteriota bacterium]
MTWPACGPEALAPRTTADGSFSLWSTAFAEGFHSAAGALAEARAKFIAPAGLERFPAGAALRVVEVAVGTGTNTAALLEAAAGHGLALDWWGLELDPRPLALALAAPAFRRQWRPGTCHALAALAAERMRLGDARHRLAELAPLAGSVDLVLLDAFSPRRCPQLWTVEFLAALARLLAPQGRLLTYSAAAAVRQGLRLAGLQLASLVPPAGPLVGSATGQAAGPSPWSQGTAASPDRLPPGGALAPLSPMELEHLATRAAEPYRDPDGQADAATITAARRRAQAASGAGSTSAWRRRWHLGGGG